MPRAYPRELRERVLRAYETGLTQEDVAEQFDISRKTLVMWLRRRRETGSIEPRPHGGGAVAKVDTALLEAVLVELPDGTRAELTARYNESVERRDRVHESSVYRALRREGYVSKKNSRDRRSKSDRMSR